MKHLLRFATLPKLWQRVAVVAAHLPLILFIGFLHVLESLLRGVYSFGVHTFAGAGNTAQDCWNHMFDGLAALVRDVVKVIKGVQL